MIREFWQEQKEEKKRQKELKKKNKKKELSKEQKAYKVFGVLFILFIMIVPIIYTCSGGSSLNNYSWSKIIGISDDLISKLETPVDRKNLITNKQIDIVDWSNCKDVLVDSGVGGVIVNNNIDALLLSGKTESLDKILTLDNSIIGALAQKLVFISSYGNDVELIEVFITCEDDDIMLTSLCRINLSTLISVDYLPYVYVKTTSKVEILNNQMYSLNSIVQINELSEEDNKEILEVIDKNSFYTFEFFTNELIAKQINLFAEGISSIVSINNSKLQLCLK